MRPVVLLLLSVLLLPGMALAQATSRPVELFMVPPGPMAADGTDQVLTFVVTDGMGALAAEALFKGSRAEFGKLSDFTQAGPGVWTCLFTTPENSQMSQVRLDIRVKVDKEQVRRDYYVDLRPPPVHTLELTADPPEMVKKRDRHAVLTIQASAPDEGPLDGLDLEIRASVGTVDQLGGLGNGQYQARYTMPEGKPTPEVAFLTVTDRAHPHETAAFLTIPLIGNITWEVDTGMAGVEVSFEIGDKRFGPVAADAKGIAGVPILVPPGAETAVAVVGMADGNMSQPIDLKVPQYRQMTLAPVAPHYPGDGVTSYPIRLTVVDRAGRPVNNAPVELQATAGTVTEPKHRRAGIYVAEYTPPVVHEVTTVELGARIPGHEPSVDSLTFDVVPSGPAAFDARVEPMDVGPGEASVQLHAQVTALGGGQAEEIGAVFYRSDGEIADTAATGMGAYLSGHAGNFDRPCAFLAQATLRATDKPPVSLVAWSVDGQLQLQERTSIVVMALDRYGLPVAGVDVSARSLQGGGDLAGGGPTDGYGRSIVEFTAARLGGLSMVEVMAGDLTWHLPIWQGVGDMPRFPMPRSGGADRLAAWDKWAPLTRSLLAGPGVGVVVDEEE